MVATTRCPKWGSEYPPIPQHIPPPPPPPPEGTWNFIGGAIVSKKYTVDRIWGRGGGGGLESAWRGVAGMVCLQWGLLGPRQAGGTHPTGMLFCSF